MIILKKIWDFIKYLFGDWGSLMSGIPSIPFVYLGIIHQGSQKDFFYILAIICLLFAAYRAWSRQVQKSTPYYSFKSFLERKARAVNFLSLGNAIEIDKMQLWYEKLLEGIKTVYGGHIPSGDIADSLRVIESRVIVFPVVPDSDINDFKKAMDDCHGQVALMVISIKPYVVPNFEVKNLEEFE